MAYKPKLNKIVLIKNIKHTNFLDTIHNRIKNNSNTSNLIVPSSVRRGQKESCSTITTVVWGKQPKYRSKIQIIQIKFPFQ